MQFTNFFISRIYLQIGDLSTKLNEAELNLAVPDLLKTLLQNKSSDNVKCCCQILKVSFGLMGLS